MATKRRKNTTTKNTTKGTDAAPKEEAPTDAAPKEEAPTDAAPKGEQESATTDPKESFRAERTRILERYREEIGKDSPSTKVLEECQAELRALEAQHKQALLQQDIDALCVEVRAAAAELRFAHSDRVFVLLTFEGGTLASVEGSLKKSRRGGGGSGGGGGRRSSKARDPRLPPEGTVLVAPDGQTEVQFTETAEVYMAGERYASVHMAGKALTGNTVNGYAYFKLGKPGERWDPSRFEWSGGEQPSA